MEYQLSSSQRDKLLFDESKEDSQFERDIAKAILELNQTLAQSMQQMLQSIMFVAQGLGRSMEIIGNALATSNNTNSQNPFFSQNTYIEIDHRHQIIFNIHKVLISSRVLMVFLLVVTII